MRWEGIGLESCLKHEAWSERTDIYRLAECINKNRRTTQHTTGLGWRIQQTSDRTSEREEGTGGFFDSCTGYFPPYLFFSWGGFPYFCLNLIVCFFWMDILLHSLHYILASFWMFFSSFVITVSVAGLSLWISAWR